MGGPVAEPEYLRLNRAWWDERAPEGRPILPMMYSLVDRRPA